MYARTLAVVYGLLAAMGLIPALNTTFGQIPIHGHDVWLHAATALLAGDEIGVRLDFRAY